MMYNTNMTKPSKFTGEMYGMKVSVEYPNSDISLDEAMDAFETLLTGLGYHPDALKQWIIERAEEYKEEDNQSEDDEENQWYEESKTNKVISILREMDVDGDTMQYIVEQVGLDEQLAIQLATLYPDVVQEHIEEMLEEGILKDEDDFEPHISDNFQIGPEGAYEHDDEDDFPEPNEDLAEAFEHFIKTMREKRKNGK